MKQSRSIRSWIGKTGRPGGVELYPNGLWFAYGDEHGREEALSADPFPEDVRTLNVPGEVSARTIAPGVFREVWDQAAERPTVFWACFSDSSQKTRRKRHSTAPEAPGGRMKDQSISLAGGCFWGMEALYRRLPGVTDVVCGYANGDSAAHANYEDVCTGITGFREAVQVTWDPAETSLEAMLFAFFAVVDVELPNRQGADIGTQYQTGIYWMTPDQEERVRAVADMEAAAVPFFAVELKPLETFFPAEESHQRYLEKHPRGYCHISPARRSALERFPFRRQDYTRPARQLLTEWIES